jgi:adenosylcobinamide kinase/adenosylcobinamide-phosphate guanylyltransferase
MRSGKNSYAEQLALSLSDNPVYLATSRIWDDEFKDRVLKHQANRGTQWTNIEEEKNSKQVGTEWKSSSN